MQEQEQGSAESMMMVKHQYSGDQRKLQHTAWKA
jgi:hypothetical protein